MLLLFIFVVNFVYYWHVFDVFIESFHIRTDRVHRLYDEIKIIKKLEV